MNISGRRVLLTGGTHGIGQASALALARAGARVVTCYRADTVAAKSLAETLDSIGAGHQVVQADITDEGDVARLIKLCRDTMSGLDVLVNNAGVDGSAALPELTVTEWRRVIDLDLTAVYAVTQAALPLLSAEASVINLGASVAVRGRAASAHYTAAKAALIGLTRSLAKELGPGGVRVNVIAPGVVDDALPGHVRQRLQAMTALGRLCTPQDVAGAVLFLAGDLSKYITGITLNVDGGM
ncbi:SDR family NAD(P)-dependent oxidoreductase [Nonomuraea sp. NPDC059007]|uniref:SDR family NAD(P)-dependent oxidoreductase n=1 Tax=Nonomuraea sp. NPDC059007 TaxID=3346692 RepID=UPI003694C57D